LGTDHLGDIGVACKVVQHAKTHDPKTWIVQQSV
jgi:hypothetical protein